MADITSFISSFGGGARVNRFKVTASSDVSGLTEFNIRAASIPESIIRPIGIQHQGRTFNIPGDREYVPWNIVVLDEGAVHKSFHTWSNSVNNHQSNSLNPKPFSETDWTVDHLQTNGTGILKTFKLAKCWPIAVGPLQFDMSQDNTIAAFAVTIKYAYLNYQ